MLLSAGSQVYPSPDSICEALEYSNRELSIGASRVAVASYLRALIETQQCAGDGFTVRENHYTLDLSFGKLWRQLEIKALCYSTLNNDDRHCVFE